MTASLLATLYPDLFGSQRAPQYAAKTLAPPSSRPRIQSAQPGRAVPSGLSMRPTIVVNGETVVLVPIGDLAKAVGRSVSHVRVLEQQGVLPPAPRRRRVRGHRGWRLYDARFVAAVAVIAAEERIPQRRAVHDLSRFQSRVWEAHAQVRGATAPTTSG